MTAHTRTIIVRADRAPGALGWTGFVRCHCPVCGGADVARTASGLSHADAARAAAALAR